MDKEVKFPLFANSIKRLIARQRKSGSAFARSLNLHPCTVVEWTNGRRLPKKFLREILKELYPQDILYDDENDHPPR